MLIAVNAGNSRVLLGGYEEDGQVFSASIATEPKLTRDDYACKLQQVLLLYGVNVRRIHGGIVSSVVPSMVGVLEGALRLLGIRDVIEVSSGVKTGLNIRSEQPRQVGSDRVAAAVAARAKGKLPCVAITLGTATTFTALDQSGALVGSAITAGVQLSLLALREQAAQLPAVAIDAKDEGILARNTVVPCASARFTVPHRSWTAWLNALRKRSVKRRMSCSPESLRRSSLPICVSRSSTMKALCSTVCT
ncbi:MAG: type III pantothenate kinase [Butyricicoccus sp.]